MGRTGLMIIRAWIEEGSEQPLRAQLRIVDDVATGIERAVTLVQPEAVSATVQQWLDDFRTEAS